MATHTALIVGATGLVGKELVRLLLTRDYYHKITVLARRELNIKDNRLKVLILEDFGAMDTLKDQLNAEDVYCLLGTTIKQAGSKEAFERIDLEYPLQLAKLAKTFPDFQQYLVVTAAGSNADSPLFYNRVKGQLEEQLRALDLPALKIFRPSLLIGQRDHFRLGEEIAKVFTSILAFFMVGRHSGLFSIKGSDVAKAMLYTARLKSPGTQIIKSADMVKLANQAGA